ncbi:alpha-tubulin suppressor-like RCC1 family protein [Mumia flava]|uniref:Alpha-tubulin suppressor-like RCC1 family protein n=1 Tax=Mumia flava TaxID=1348852 RepID=A0A0B2BUB3_9ACTN|nr:hypothetical protein [Mumia flava]PJJ57970.1 alpha-tubulin suppressor-like RCC1 family protein [Mumia flava]
MTRPVRHSLVAPAIALTLVGAGVGAAPIASAATPTPPPTVAQATLIAAGNTHTVVVGADGRPYGTGSNGTGQITGTDNPKTTLTPMTGLPSGVHAAAVSAEFEHSLVLGDDGIPYATGRNGHGQLTDEDEENPDPQRTTLTPMVGLPSGVSATAAAAGANYSLVLGDDGVAYGTGYGSNGQITGNAIRTYTLTPMELPPDVRAVAIAASVGSHSLVLGDDGIAYGTGYNGYGQLTGTQTTKTTLTPLTGLPDGVEAIAIDAGQFHSLVLGDDGVAYGTGDNRHGELTGEETELDTLTPLAGLPSGVDAVAISAGNFTSVVLGSDGIAYGTGSSDDGRLTGDGSRDTLTPLAGVPSVTGPIAQISAGSNTTLLLGRNGVVYGTGRNDKGQLTGEPTLEPQRSLKPLSGQPIVRTSSARITGTRKVGRLLTARGGTWLPSGAKVDYRWYRGGKPITSATHRTYRLVRADWKKRIKVRITATLPGSSDATTSAPTARVRLVLKNTKRPKIRGKKKVGKRLKATKGRWNATPTRVAYRWYRGKKKIRGAKGGKRVYRVRKADAGKKLRVRVTAKAPYTTAARATSKKVKIRRR